MARHELVAGVTGLELREQVDREAEHRRAGDVADYPRELGPAAGRHPLPPIRVVYQDACHLNHAQGVAAQPRELLSAIPGVELVEIDEAGTCCGSAGIYNLVQPRTARELGERKARAIILAAGPGPAQDEAERMLFEG